MTHHLTDTRPRPSPPQPTPEEQRSAVVRLVLIVATVVAASFFAGVTSTVLVVAAIIAMIMLHELGHFVTAKWAGMKVTEFFLGFGPRLWSVRRGETEYGVKAIPAGGYVKIIGMSNLDQVDPADEHRTYRQQGYWRRLSVAVAGSAVHFLIAFVLLFLIFAAVGVPDDRHYSVGAISRLRTGPSPAEEAGFQLGDRIVTVDGRSFAWPELVDYIQARPGQPISFEVDRGGQRLVLAATPVDLSKVRLVGVKGWEPPEDPTGFVGIGPTFAVERLGPVAALGRSVTGVGRLTVETVKALATVFSPEGASSYGRQLLGHDTGTPGVDTPRFLSPVGFVRVASQAADTGWREVLTLLLTINVFVGLFNMIPLLPLDGGHVAIATYEALRSRRGRRYHADIAKAMPVYYLVFMLLVFLAVTSLYLDIVRPLTNPFE